MEGGTRGQGLHGRATTTHAGRNAIPRSNASVKTLSQTGGIQPKTVLTWRQRQTVDDPNTGIKPPPSTGLSKARDAPVVACRRHPLLPLDDGLLALKPTLPSLRRASLHRGLKRPVISRLPQAEDDPLAKKRVTRAPIGKIPIEIAKRHPHEGTRTLVLAMDRTSTVVLTHLGERARPRRPWPS